MELRDYLAALRRYWTTWVGLALVGLTIALVVVVSATPVYQARAAVFVASAAGDGNSGAQFVRQRVTSYPDVARSEAVLGPVIESVGLTSTVAELRARVSADNPLETSQIDITVTDEDPVQAAAIANAVGDQFRRTVEELERPGDGSTPVSLTVTDPANVPSSPVSPQVPLLLGLGLVVGLALGAAVAVLRSRTDTRVHTADDVRDAWGAGAAGLAVFTSPPRRRASRLSGRPESLIARRLAAPAGSVPVRAVVLGASAGDDQRLADAFADRVTADLLDGGVPARVTGPVGSGTPSEALGVHLATATADLPLSEWRRVGQDHDGVVLVAEAGRVDRADLQEIQSVLAAADARLLAVVLLHPRRRGTRAPTALDAAARRSLTGKNLTRPRQKVALGDR